MGTLSRVAILAIAALLAMAGQSFAFERGASFTVLPGTTMGIPFAYAGPPGLTFYNLANYGTVSVPRDSAPNIGFGPGTIKADVPDDVPAFVWTTPWTLFGARYEVLVAQPAAQIKSYGFVPGLGQVYSDTGGLRDTVVGPVRLSWNLGHGLFVGTGLNIAVPDGHIKGINGVSSLGMPYWTFEPTFGVSYLGHGFDLTATFLYDVYTTNPYSHVTDGQALYADFTATKLFGHLEIGPVAYVALQTTRDRGGSRLAFLRTRGLANSCEPIAPNIANGCVRAAKAGIGGKIGYLIPRGEIALLATGSVLSHGQGGADGWRIWTQFRFKLYKATDPPPPLLPKLGRLFD